MVRARPRKRGKKILRGARRRAQRRHKPMITFFGR